MGKFIYKLRTHLLAIEYWGSLKHSAWNQCTSLSINSLFTCYIYRYKPPTWTKVNKRADLLYIGQ